MEKAKNKYFCSKCERYHQKYYRGKLSETFKNHFEYKIEISEIEAWIKQFKKSWNKYKIKDHKETGFSKKQ
jgi:hypothetical protein